MSRPSRSTLVSIVVPVFNGADTLAQTVESVLTQTHSNLELVISDNASTDGTQELCRELARNDPRVVYHRHPENIGLLNNFICGAQKASGRYVRWLGDDDSLEPDYIAQTLGVFAEDRRRVLATTQIVYTDAGGGVTLNADYDPAALASSDPLERFAEILRLFTSGYSLLDPVYSMMRRELALLPRRNMLREDEVFAARLALAGAWGHVAVPLAGRRRSEVTPGLVQLLGVPWWHTHAMDVLQCMELLHWVAQSSLDPGQRRGARAEVVKMYGRRKWNKCRRGKAKLERIAARPRVARDHPGALGGVDDVAQDR